MQFYNRETELEQLEGIRKQSLKSAQFTVLTGRRRIGKTHFLLHASKEKPVLYFFVARKSESLLCQDFTEEIKQKLNLPVIGETNRFIELFKVLMEHSKENPFTLIIDEFQEFYHVAPSVFSEIQHYWDVYHNDSRINLIVSGSVFSMMHKIFENAKEPLFGRAGHFIRLQPFQTEVIKHILADHNPSWSPDDLLALFMFSGGVPKYIKLFMDAGACTKQAMIDQMISENSPFLNEGKSILIEEFGKEYATYFSILTTIARGENTRPKIEAAVQREVGGFLSRLEKDYSLISKTLPIFAKTETKNVRYTIQDNFLTFWFRFIYKYSYIIEIQGFDLLKEIINRDYNTFSGLILERYFLARYRENSGITRLGGYWNRKGINEIDIIAVNELTMKADVVEVKRNHQNIDLNKLREKTFHFKNATGKLKDFKIKYKGLSLRDM